ncbi:hypothetical protein QVD17_13515 [Tagetes erecta]|uniref:Gnk2-homologous domain-containing protein n=1 Tax=Tagetes erecta TaxID=13708 RepID=A0AAD8KX55_TARER|nr:hypothetical protein QVD17_13515 [Tagetes erecta]
MLASFRCQCQHLILTKIISNHLKMKFKFIISFQFLLQAITNNNSVTVPQSQSLNFGVYKCRNTSNFTSIAYQTSLQTALNSLPGNVAYHGGFYRSTVGNSSNTPVNALALCHGDIGPEACEECVKISIPSLRRNCRNQKEAAAWYTNCIVRYSDREMIGVLDSWTFDELSNTATVSNNGDFDNALNNLTIRLQVQIAAGDSFRKLAVGSVTYGSELFTIYGIIQCTPDLSKDQCSKCLYGIITELTLEKKMNH